MTVPHLWKGRVLRAVAAIEGGVPSVAIYDDSADQKLFYNSGRLIPAGQFAALPALWNLCERVESGELSAEEKLPFGKTFDEAAAEIIAGSADTLNALMGFLGFEGVSAAAKRAGMADTEIVLPVGAPGAEKFNLTCASDAAVFFRKLIRREGLSEESCARLVKAFSDNAEMGKFAAAGVPTAHLAASMPGCEYDAGIFFPESEAPIAAAVMTVLLTARGKGVEFCERTARALAGKE